MDRRIYGIETEFGITCATQGQRRLSPDEVARFLFRKVVAWGRSSNVFLRNGGRLYLDVGSHPEYATAECDNLPDLIAQDRAGELILQDLVADATARMAHEGIDGEIFLFKNNTDSAGNSYGCHENYLVGRPGEFSAVSDVLLPFLVSRQIVTGAGKVLNTPRGTKYVFSQRADHMWEGVSSATTRSRPIINTRDEPHADPELYRRLHVIVGDSNMAEPTVELKVGSTDLVLRMIEEGTRFPDLALENPIRAIREISHDLTGRSTVRLTNGKTIRATELQREYLSAAQRFTDSHGLDDATTRRWLDLWERGVVAVEQQDPSLVQEELDWAIKLRLIERYTERNDVPLDDPRVARMDLAYHDIDPDRGLHHRLVKRGMVRRVIDDAAVATAADNPPQTTRAKLRGDFIAAAQAKRRDFTVDWVHLKVNDQTQRTILCKDPFRNTDERVQRLIDAL